MVYFVFTPRCFPYRKAATTFYQLQRGFGGRRQHARIQDFLSVLFSPKLVLQFTEGVQWFIAEKTILILYQGSRGVHYFPGGGLSNFFQGEGVQMLISLETDIHTCYFPGGGGGPDPLSPSGSAHGQCHPNGTIFITVPILTKIIRH